MKKSLLVLALMATFAGSASAVPLAPLVTGSVASQSQASASSSGTGTAFSSTQSGSFATFGQTGSYTNAGPGSVGGTANVSGYVSTAGYTTSTSSTTGSGVASSSSWNSATARANSQVNAIGNGVGTIAGGYAGEASGHANSHSSADVATESHHGVNSDAIQGNTAFNEGGYSASDSLIARNNDDNTTFETRTSAIAFDNSHQDNTTVFDTGAVPNAGTDINNVSNGGFANAVAN